MNYRLLKIKFTILALLCSFSYLLTAQEIYFLDGTNISTCNALFQDSGGAGTYAHNEDHVVTICSADPNKGSHIQIIFNDFGLGLGDYLQFYDGPDTNATLLARDADFYQGGQWNVPFIIQATAANLSGCITLRFKSDSTSVDKGWVAQISCVPLCQVIQSKLVSTEPAVFPIDTGWIDGCIGEPITFTGKGLYPQNGLYYQHSDSTSRFIWEFDDNTNAEGRTVTHSYNQPGGYVVQLKIVDSLGCSSINFINQRVRIAPRPNFKITGTIDTELCLDDTISLTTSLNQKTPGKSFSVIPNTEGFVQRTSRANPFALPDGTGTSFRESLYFTQFPTGALVQDACEDLLCVFVNIEHSWARDLEITLTCPNGQSAILHKYMGQVGNRLILGEPIDDNTQTPGVGWDYFWRNDCPDHPRDSTILEWGTARAPADGSYTMPSQYYRPYELFDKFLGCPLNGEWTINIQDLWGNDDGYVFGWGLKFNPDLFVKKEIFSPQLVTGSWKTNPDIQTNTQNDFSGTPTTAGTSLYTYEVVDEFGCTSDTTFAFTILPKSHPDCYECFPLVEDIPDTVVCEGGSVQLSPILKDEVNSEIEFGTRPGYYWNEFWGNSIDSASFPIMVAGIRPDTIASAGSQIVTVCVDMQATIAQSIALYLETPDGRRIALTNFDGGMVPIDGRICFDVNASQALSGAQSNPINGVFLPAGNFDFFNGSPINGTWKLILEIDEEDSQPDEEITINSWTIILRDSKSVGFAWTNLSNNLSCTDCAQPMAAPSNNAVYYLRTTDNYSCSFVDSVSVTIIPDLPAPSVSCLGNNAGVGFQWSPVPTVTQYEIRVSINGVTGDWQGPVNDTVYTVPGSSLSIEDEVSLDVRAYVPANSLQCNIGEGNSSCIYNPCQLRVDSVIIIPVPCFGEALGRAKVFGFSRNGQLSYLWSDPLAQFEQEAVNLVAGDYKVTITDNLGCIDSVAVTIPEPAPYSITADSISTSCFGTNDGKATVVVSGANAPYSFLWDNNQSTPSATGLSAGVHSVEISDAKNCKTKRTINIASPEELKLSINQNQSGCFGSKNNQLTALATGGTGADYQYLWSSGHRTSTATGLDSILYSVTVTDRNGCEAEGSFKAKNLAPIVANIIDRKPTCNGGSDGAIGINIVKGGAGQTDADYSFQWNNNSRGPILENIQGGRTYTVIITDQQGCTGKVDRFLEDAELLRADTASLSPKCFGGADGSISLLNPFSPNGGPFTYQWSANANGATGADARGLMAGLYTVTMTDNMGCEASLTIPLTQPKSIQLIPQTSHNTCAGDAQGKINTTVTGGMAPYTIAWSNGEQGNSLSGLLAGSYGVTITDSGNCEEITSVVINEPDSLNLTLLVTDVSCFGFNDGKAEITIQGGTSPFLYRLNNGTYRGTRSFVGLKAGEHQIQIKDANNCLTSRIITVGSPEQFFIDAGPKSRDLVLGDSLQLDAIPLNAQGVVDYFWKEPTLGVLSCLTCPNPWVRTFHSTFFEVLAIDEKGCEAGDLIKINVEKPRTILVPTGFSPNQDNSNDRLLVHGKSGTTILTFRVYDRWGALIHESGGFMVNDTTSGWDGMHRGQPAAQGVYVWYLEAEFIDGEKKSFQGQTTLLK